MEIKIKKRQILRHNGTVTIDANFVDANGSINHTFVCPIDATEEEIAKDIKTWLEQKEESDANPYNEMTPLDISKVETDWKDRKEYEKEKGELAEMMELVKLGAIDANDQKVKSKQTKVKNKHKEKFRKE